MIDKYRDKSEENKIAELNIQNQYKKAKLMMEETPFIIRNKAILTVLITYASMYHIFSVILSLITVAIIATLFAPMALPISQVLKYIILIVIFAILATLIVVAEIAKSNTANEFFKRKATNNSLIPTSLVVTLVGLCLFSVLASSSGGYLLAYYVSSEKATLIEDAEGTADTLSYSYDKIIKGKEESLASLQSLASNTKKRQWGLTSSETNLVNSLSKEIEQMKMEKEASLASTKEKYDKKITKDADYTLVVTGIVAFVIIILEVITIYSYHLRYWYWATAASLSDSLKSDNIKSIQEKMNQRLNGNGANISPRTEQMGFKIPTTITPITPTTTPTPTTPTTTTTPTTPMTKGGFNSQRFTNNVTKEIRVQGRKDPYDAKTQISLNKELSEIIIASWLDPDPKTKNKGMLNINYLAMKSGKDRRTIIRTVSALIEEKKLPNNSYSTTK